MLRLLLVPLIPIFVMLVKSLLDDYMTSRRQKLATQPKPKPKRDEQKTYDHKWDNDE